MSAGFAVCGTVTTREIAEKVRGDAGLPWAGTYSGDPLASAVALKSLDIVLRDRLHEAAAEKGAYLRERLDELKSRYDCIGDVRGRGLYQMLDIVSSSESRRPDYQMAERIRYNTVLHGLLVICVKNYMRISPPLIVTREEIDELVGRLEQAVQSAVDGYPRDVDFTASSSLAASR